MAKSYSRFLLFACILLVLPTLLGASCNTDTVVPEDPKEVVGAIDKSQGVTAKQASPHQGAKVAMAGNGAGTSKDKTGNVAITVPIDVSRLDTTGKQRLNSLLDSLPSPCGKAHSLRKSFSDPQCKRSLYAGRYVATYLEYALEDEQIKQLYDARYKLETPKKFDLSQAPAKGAEKPRVLLVEFFDYGCPACKRFKPAIETAVAKQKSFVRVVYKQFPLDSHVHSGPAAQAAIAAHTQGKFTQMHDLLFANQSEHKPADLTKHAKKLGLNMKQFTSDFAAAEALVKADQKEGVANGVSSTPTLFINGRMYAGPGDATFISLWIEEELARSAE